jgi:hypothetical protein
MRRSLWIFDVGQRQMQNREMAGWMPYMGIFSGLALFVMLTVRVRVGMDWALAVASVIDLLVAQHFVRRFGRRLRRLGLFGATRARWWIELAALDLTLCFSSGLFSLAHRNGQVLPAWQQVMVDGASQTMELLSYPFLGFTIVAYMLGLLQGRRMSGRSLELVNFFFWLYVIDKGIDNLPQDASFAVIAAIAIGVIAVVMLGIAGVLATRQHLRKRDHVCDVPTNNPAGTESGPPG